MEHNNDALLSLIKEDVSSLFSSANKTVYALKITSINEDIFITESTENHGMGVDILDCLKKINNESHLEKQQLSKMLDLQNLSNLISELGKIDHKLKKFSKMIPKNSDRFYKFQSLLPQICQHFQTTLDLIKQKINFFGCHNYEKLYGSKKIDISMPSSIQYAGRGIIQDVVDKSIFYVLDFNGLAKKIQKILPGVYKDVKHKNFNLGGSSSGCSIMSNFSGTNLLITGCTNKEIYLTSIDFDIIKKWDCTDSKNSLWRLVWIDDSSFCIGYWGGVIKCFHIDSQTPFLEKSISDKDIWTLVNGRQTNELLIGDWDGAFMGFNVLTASILWCEKKHSSAVTSINYLRTKKLFMTGGDDYKILFWHEINKNILHQIDLNSQINNICVSPHEAYLIVLDDNELRLMKNSNGSWETISCLHKNDFSSSRLFTIHVDWKKNEILMGSEDGKIWSILLSKT